MNSIWLNYYTNELSQMKKLDGWTSYFLHIDELFSIRSSGPKKIQKTRNF